MPSFGFFRPNEKRRFSAVVWAKQAISEDKQMSKRNRPGKFQVRHCEVCGFPFSDVHHVIPSALGEGRDLRALVRVLCPNHHRLAHILYSFIEYNPRMTSSEIKQQFGKHFDEIFLAKMFDELFTAYSIAFYWYMAQRNDDVLIWISKGYGRLTQDFINAGDYAGWHFTIFANVFEEGRPEKPETWTIEESRMRWLIELGHISISVSPVDGVMEAKPTAKGIRLCDDLRFGKITPFRRNDQ